MKTRVPELLLYTFSDFLSKQTGLVFKREKWKQLDKGISAAAEEFGFDNPVNCIRWLMSADLSKTQIETLGSHLTVGETYFFREPKSFEMFETSVLPEVIRKGSADGKRIRIWSAACSSGEEPYSIAMVLDNRKKELKDYQVLILATDINRKALKKAREGIYSEWSFRGMPQWMKSRHFKQEGKNQYIIRPHLRDMVTFDYINLVEDHCPSMLSNTNGMDIIFCRNVLMYFSSEVARKVVENLSRCLVTGGWLIVSPTDAFSVVESDVLRLESKNAPIYRKIPAPPPSVLVEQPCAPIIKRPEIRPAETPPNDLYKPPTGKISPRQIEEIPVESPGKAAPVSPFDHAYKLFKQGFYMDAVDILKPLAEDEPSSELFELMARSLANQGKLEQAAEWCQKAIDSNKLNPNYRYLLATIQLEQGLKQEAVMSLKQSLYIDHDFIPAHFSLGNIALQEQDISSAHRYFDNTMSLLDTYNDDDAVIELEEGLTAGRMKEIIIVLKQKESFK